MSDKINGSFLTEEAKEDINNLLGFGSGGDGGGNSEKFIIYQEGSAGENIFYIDKTKDEIREALNSGKEMVYAFSTVGGPDSGIVVYLPLVQYLRNKRNVSELTPSGDILSNTSLWFCGTCFINGGVSIIGYEINLNYSSNTATRYTA